MTRNLSETDANSDNSLPRQSKKVKSEGSSWKGLEGKDDPNAATASVFGNHPPPQPPDLVDLVNPIPWSKDPIPDPYAAKINESLPEAAPKDSTSDPYAAKIKKKIMVGILRANAKEFIEGLLSGRLSGESLRNELLQQAENEFSKIDNWRPLDPVDNRIQIDEAIMRAGLKELNNVLVHRINEIDSLLKAASEDHNKAVQAADLACVTAQDVFENKYLSQAVNHLAQIREERLDTLVTIMIHLDKFREFLTKERQLLTDNGVNTSTTDQVMDECENVFKAVWNGEAPQGDLKQSIERLRDETCRSAAELAKEQKKKTTRSERCMQVVGIVKEAGLAMGGVALLGLNVTAENLSPAEMVLSGAFGVGIIENVVDHLSDRIR